MTKQQARSRYKRIRDGVRLQNADNIALRITQTEAYRQAGVIMAYLSFGSEAPTHALVRRALADGKTVCVPVCHPADCTMTPAVITQFDRDLAPGFYGILTPRIVHPMEPKRIGLAVVPGIAFDRAGHRIGFGKGYYDRFLPMLSADAVTVGVTYSACLAEALPHDKYDIPVDAVVTEQEWIDTHCKINQ